MIGIKITLNERLYLRDPQDTALGKKIIKHSILLIDDDLAFTFKKLAHRMHSTEASVYRYFENKHAIAVPFFWFGNGSFPCIDINTEQRSQTAIENHHSNLCFASKENPSIQYVNEM